MLNILEVSKEKLTTLNHGPNVFYDALEKVRDGEERFHVTDPKGKVEYYDYVRSGYELGCHGTSGIIQY